MGLIIAIDGPAGSGKSTVAREVAKRLHFSYVDTGAIYRSLALHSLNTGLTETDEGGIAALADHLPLQIVSRPGGQSFLLGGNDVSEAIRTEQVSRLASVVSRYPSVRAKLLDLQRRLGRESAKGAVLEGRDIGTVVFPDATYKFFLTASNEERAKRRFEELQQRGEHTTFEKVLSEIIERDERDSKRDAAPMIPAKDAKLIDTTSLSLENVIKTIVSTVHESN